MNSFLVALQFLTIFPVPFQLKIRDTDLAKSVGYYPLIGGLIGAISAVVYRYAKPMMGVLIAIVLAVVASIGCSGALHLDGFADLCDGFYAGKTKDEILAIMKDPHAGSMAIVGIFSLLILKLACLVSLPDHWKLRALLIAPVLGRWSMSFLCAISIYARKDGTGRPYIGHVNRWDLAKAAVFALLIAWLLLKRKGLFLFGAATFFAWIFRAWVYRAIEGMTGDLLGACSELVEVLTLALLCMHHIPFIQ